MSGCFDVFDTLIFVNTDTVVDTLSYGILVFDSLDHILTLRLTDSS